MKPKGGKQINKFIRDNGLRRNIKESRGITEKVDTHLAKIEKEKVMERLASAFNIDDKKFEQGAAFDIELQEMRRLERVAEHQEKKRERKREEKKRRRELEDEKEKLRALEVSDKDEKSNKDSEERRDKKHKKHRRKEGKDKHQKKHKRRRRSRSRSHSN